MIITLLSRISDKWAFKKWPCENKKTQKKQANVFFSIRFMLGTQVYFYLQISSSGAQVFLGKLELTFLYRTTLSTSLLQMHIFQLMNKGFKWKGQGTKNNQSTFASRRRPDQVIFQLTICVFSKKIRQEFSIKKCSMITTSYIKVKSKANYLLVEQCNDIQVQFCETNWHVITPREIAKLWVKWRFLKSQGWAQTNEIVVWQSCDYRNDVILTS